MGIKGIYREIGPGERIALSKFAIETYERRGRPLRLAIDISIWLFQIQSGQGGTNPALRVFFYRLLRLISLSIHPLFVFDGPNKPPFKRNKRTGPNIASIPEFLAKQLLKQFGIPFHLAPGEAEAECALLQEKGIVDAVLSEDVDTLMFGSGLTLRNWSVQEGVRSNKTPTHVNVYDSAATKAGSGLDREGMILVAIMSGGDYIPEGIPGCGPKTACEAARAGFGAELCSLTKKNRAATEAFLTRLKHELQTNESKHFNRKHKALVIPDDFPRFDILKYYTHPVISSDEKLEQLRTSVKWDSEFDIPALREFTKEAFSWVCLGGAKHFVRNLSLPLLVKKLRLRAEEKHSDDLTQLAVDETKLVRSIHGKRNHAKNDDAPEIRVGYVPLDLCPVDLDVEEPDPEEPMLDIAEDGGNSDDDGPAASPRKTRPPTQYDPTKVERIWVMDTLVRIGVPLKLQDYEESTRKPRKPTARGALQKQAGGKITSPKRKKTGNNGMQNGTLDTFTKVSKSGLLPKNRTNKSLAGSRWCSEPTVTSLDLTQSDVIMADTALDRSLPLINEPFKSRQMTPNLTQPITVAEKHSIVDLLSSPENRPARRKRQFRRSYSDNHQERSCSISSTTCIDTVMPTIPGTPTIDNRTQALMELPASVNTRRRRSPLRRSQSLEKHPADAGKDACNVLDFKMPPQFKQSEFDRMSSSPRARSSQPTTPRNRKVHTTIIDITSSPAKTPPSRQRSIIDFLSPNTPRVQQRASLEPPPSPSPAPKRSTAHQISDHLVLENSPNTEEDTSRDKPLPSPPQISTPAAPCNAPTGCPQGPPNPRGPSKRTIRLRESLAGAWALDADADADANADAGNAASKTAPVPRPAPSRGARRDCKTWRVSQVTVLDLTTDD